MVYKNIFKALLSFVLDKKARDKLRTPVTENFEKDSKIERNKTLNRNSNLPEIKDKKLLEHCNRQKQIDHTRLALIDHAMNIYRSKQYIIEQLPNEQREKLMFMALKIFGEQKNNSKPEW